MVTGASRCGDGLGIECYSTAYISWYQAGNSIRSINDVQVRDGFAYVAERTWGLGIIDVTDPGAPGLISVFRPVPFSGPNYTDLAVRGDYVYLVTDRVDGSFVIDVSDPQSPVLAGMLEEVGQPSDLALVGERLYISSGGDVDVYDVSSPGAPVHVGVKRYNTTLKCVTAASDLVAVGIAFTGFSLVDYSDPAAPVVLSEVALDGNPEDVMLVGNFLYVAIRGGGLLVYDCSDPVSPMFRASIETDGLINQMRLVGQTLYVSGVGRGVLVLDVSDPGQPTVMGRFGSTAAKNVARDGSVLFIADEESGLVSVVADRLMPEPVVFEYESDWMGPDGIVGYAGVATVFDTRSGEVEIIDMSGDKAVPLRRVRFDRPTDVAFVEDGCYVVDAQGIWFVDGSTLSPAGLVEDRAGLRAIDVSGGYLYAGGADGVLRIYNRVGPFGGLDQMGELAPNGWGNIAHIDAEGDACVFQGDSTTVIADVSDPDSPRRGAILHLSGSRVVFDGTHIWAPINAQRSVYIYDATDRDEVHFLGNISVPATLFDIAVRDRVLAVSMRTNGVMLFDASFPTAPRPMGRYLYPRPNEYIAYIGENVAVTTDGGPVVAKLARGRCVGCEADLAQPWGLVDFFDVAEFVWLYSSADPAADLVEPFGVFNFFDVAAYLDSYNANCP